MTTIHGINHSTILKEMHRKLPVIEGVYWKCEVYKVAASPDVQFIVQASFKIDTTMGFELREVISKVHRITSDGQVLLELEK